MKYTLKTAAVVSILCLGLTGCAGGNTTPSTTTEPSPSVSETSTSTASGRTLTTSITELGEIIVGEDGKTVYYFTKDQKDSGKSECVDKCLENWPPVLVENEPTFSEDITAKVGTIDTPDGKKQVTVDGLPVYYWYEDKEPGEVKGQGVGNVWYAVAPDGTMITGASSSTSTSRATGSQSPSPMDTGSPTITTPPNE